MSSAGYELQFNVGMRRTFYTRVARAALAGPRIVKDHETEIRTGYRNHMFTRQLFKATFKANADMQLINYARICCNLLYNSCLLFGSGHYLFWNINSVLEVVL